MKGGGLLSKKKIAGKKVGDAKASSAKISAKAKAPDKVEAPAVKAATEWVVGPTNNLLLYGELIPLGTVIPEDHDWFQSWKDRGLIIEKRED